MSPRSALMQLLIKAGIGVAALFVVGVVLAAIPNHRPPVMTETGVEAGALEPPAQEQAVDHGKMPGMSLDMDDAKSSEPDAIDDMAHMHHADNQHMHRTALRPQTAADVER